MTYHALDDDSLTPAEIGWVLVVEGNPALTEPQALTAAEACGDLITMIDPEHARASIQVFTGGMIEALERRATAATGPDEAALRARADELRAELAQAAAMLPSG